MALSALQRAVLRAAYRAARGRVPRAALSEALRRSKSVDYSAEILSRSIDRLIDRGLLVGYGHRTQDKWFIEAVRLTPAGRHQARFILKAQASLPLK